MSPWPLIQQKIAGPSTPICVLVPLLSSATSSHLLGCASRNILSGLERAIRKPFRSWCRTVVVRILIWYVIYVCISCVETLGTHECSYSVDANMMIMDVGYHFFLSQRQGRSASLSLVVMVCFCGSKSQGNARFRYLCLVIIDFVW